MDVLLRFYERHAFICALHKETRLLFDELVFCLQRLYSVPIYIDLPFASETLDDIPLAYAGALPAGYASSTGQFAGTPCSEHGCQGQKHAYDSCCCSNCVCNDSSSQMSNNSGGSNVKLRRPLSSASKSRIPRPISLPKRLESKLSASPSPVRGVHGTAAAADASARVAKVRASPTTGPVRPTTAGDRKSRVRDTVKLFDSKDLSHRRGGSASKRHSMKSPKTGAGEAMALEDTGGNRR